MRKLVIGNLAVLVVLAAALVSTAQNSNSSNANSSSSSSNNRQTNTNRSSNKNKNANVSASRQSNSNSSSSGDLIDINSASKSQLMALEGVGDAYSDKIIQGRPYKMKSDLVKRGIIPQALYNRISGKIIAHQPKH